MLLRKNTAEDHDSFCMHGQASYVAAKRGFLGFPDGIMKLIIK